VGSAAPGTWPHPARGLVRRSRGLSAYDARWLPGESLWACVDTAEEVPKATRHDHLPGAKGSLTPLRCTRVTVRCGSVKAPFDALALLAADVPRVVAIFGVQGWHWAWARDVRALVCALSAGCRRAAAVAPARPVKAALRGKRVAWLEPRCMGGMRMRVRRGQRACWRWAAPPEGGKHPTHGYCGPLIFFLSSLPRPCIHRRITGGAVLTRAGRWQGDVRPDTRKDE